MVLLARYYAAGARLARNDVEPARAELERVRAEADRHPEFIALGAHVRWELARAYLHLDDPEVAVPLLGAGRGDVPAHQRQCERGVHAGQPRRRADLARTRQRGVGSADGVVHGAERDDRRRGAAGGERVRGGGGRVAHGPSRVGAGAGLGEPGDCGSGRAGAVRRRHVRSTRRSSRPSPAMPRPPSAWRAAPMPRRDTFRTRSCAPGPWPGSPWPMAPHGSTADPPAAAASLTRAIEFYRARHLDFGLPEPLLLRARSARKAGDLTGASRDLDEGIAIVERHPLRESGVVLGVGVLDAERALFTDAIEASLDAGDPVRAFAIAERAHGTAITMRDVQRRLRGSGTVVLEIVALPREIVTFAIGDERVGDLPAARIRRVVEWARRGEPCRQATRPRPPTSMPR